MIIFDVLKSVLTKKNKTPVYQYRAGTERFKLKNQKDLIDVDINHINQTTEVKGVLEKLLELETKNFKVKLTNNDKDYVFSHNKTVIENAEDFGIDLKYSCSMGGCGSCKIKMISGSVDMQEDNCLTDEEKSEGYILACISYIREDTVLEI